MLDSEMTKNQTIFEIRREEQCLDGISDVRNLYQSPICTNATTGKNSELIHPLPPLHPTQEAWNVPNNSTIETCGLVAERKLPCLFG
jgi:hypothetical protein